MNRYSVSGRCALLSVAMLMAAPAVRAESLADAIALAYAHNPTLVRQRYVQKSNDENYVQTRSQYGPHLSVQGTANYQRQDAPPLGLQTGNQWQVLGQITQPLYTSGRLRGQLLSARAGVQAGQQTLRQVEQQIIQDVIIVYAQVLRDEQRVDVARENVAVLQDQLRQNRERYTAIGKGKGAGDVTLTDVGQADERLAAAEATLASIQSSLDISRSQYLQIVGRNPGTLDPLPELPGMPKSVDEAFAAAEANNPGLLSAKYSEQASSATAASVRGQLGPSVSLTAQGSYANQIVPFDGRNGNKNFVAGVTVTQPLFAAGQLRSQVRQADAQNAADQATIDITRRSTIQAVAQAWSQLVSTRQSLIAGEREITSAQLAFAGMHREELYGLRATIETLNAEQDLASAQFNFLENRFEEYVARAALLVAVGSLNADSITRDLPVYDPEHNFDKVKNRGRTPLEPIAQMIDRVGSANPRRPLAADLKGSDTPVPDATQAMLPTPSKDVMQKTLVPITQSPLVPASALPGGLPRTGALPAKPAMPPSKLP